MTRVVLLLVACGCATETESWPRFDRVVAIISADLIGCPTGTDAAVAEAAAFLVDRGFDVRMDTGEFAPNVYLNCGDIPTLGQALVGDLGSVVTIRDHLEYDLTWWVKGACTPGQPDLTGVVIHEIGHALGLDHVEDERDVMCPSFTPCVQRRQLSQARRQP